MSIILVLVLGAAVFWFFGSRTLFKVSIRSGELLVVSGRVPVRFLQDLQAVVADEKITSGTVSAVARDHGASLAFAGIPFVLNRIRCLVEDHGA